MFHWSIRTARRCTSPTSRVRRFCLHLSTRAAHSLRSVPCISSEFAAIHNDLAQTPPIYRKTHLLSVSLDPNYDTAPVLRRYGLAYLKDDASGFANWDFVSTSPADLQRLASAFGLEYSVQNNQIVHSMSTILLAPDGTVKQIWPGNQWKTSEVLAALKNATS